jgi:hypothetical protein
VGLRLIFGHRCKLLEINRLSDACLGRQNGSGLANKMGVRIPYESQNTVRALEKPNVNDGSRGCDTRWRSDCG